MNLISYFQCGVVLDKDKVIIQRPFNHDEEPTDIPYQADDNGRSMAIIACPVCGNTIFIED